MPGNECVRRHGMQSLSGAVWAGGVGSEAWRGVRTQRNELFYLVSKSSQLTPQFTCDLTRTYMVLHTRSIRALDSGSLSVEEFKATLESAGVPITNELARLLMGHQASGNASFHEFTRVIDPMLGPHEETQAFDGGSTSNVDRIGTAASMSQRRPHRAHVRNTQLLVVHR
jgi:hypothetical protein